MRIEQHYSRFAPVYARGIALSSAPLHAYRVTLPLLCQAPYAHRATLLSLCAPATQLHSSLLCMYQATQLSLCTSASASQATLPSPCTSGSSTNYSHHIYIASHLCILLQNQLRSDSIEPDQDPQSSTSESKQVANQMREFKLRRLGPVWHRIQRAQLPVMIYSWRTAAVRSVLLQVWLPDVAVSLSESNAICTCALLLSD